MTTDRKVVPSTATSVKTKLFCYGTLNVHHIQRELWGEAKEGSIVTLDGYELKLYPQGYFYIVKKPGERVVGKVYELTPEQIERTDRYEGSGYERKKVYRVGQETLETYIGKE